MEIKLYEVDGVIHLLWDVSKFFQEAPAFHIYTSLGYYFNDASDESKQVAMDLAEWTIQKREKLYNINPNAAFIMDNTFFLVFENGYVIEFNCPEGGHIYRKKLNISDFQNFKEDKYAQLFW